MNPAAVLFHSLPDIRLVSLCEARVPRRSATSSLDVFHFVSRRRASRRARMEARDPSPRSYSASVFRATRHRRLRPS